MKRRHNLMLLLTSWGHLYQSFEKAFRANRSCVEAQQFCFELERNLLKLRHQLEAGIYRPGGFRQFTIHDPKERVISVAPFRDRVVHHAVVGVLEHWLDRTFIFDSYASRLGKGLHRAVLRVQKMMRNGGSYYLKLDVKGFFASISHPVLMGLLSRRIMDREFLCLVKNILCSGGFEKGLPVGNLTSQFFANCYLDPLDHFIKEQLRVNCYVRYMDDMVLLAGHKQKLRLWKKEIETYLDENLRLRLKESATRLGHVNHGLPFLGFRIFPYLIRLQRVNRVRALKKIRKREQEYNAGFLDEDKLAESVTAILAFAETADFRQFRHQLWGAADG